VKTPSSSNALNFVRAVPSKRAPPLPARRATIAAHRPAKLPTLVFPRLGLNVQRLIDDLPHPVKPPMTPALPPAPQAEAQRGWPGWVSRLRHPPQAQFQLSLHHNLHWLKTL